MEEYLNLFDKYVRDNYDFRNSLIRQKYEHTLRVTQLVLKIGKKMGLDDQQLELAYLIALFHDLGRFKEVVRQQKFNNLTFDHGAYSNKILYNDRLIEAFPKALGHDLLIRKAVFFHNKKDLPDNLNLEEALQCQLIRDADKIDILNTIANGKRKVFNCEPSPIIKDCYLADDTIAIKDLKNSSDRVLFYLSFAKDLVYDEAYQILGETGYLEKFIQNVDVSLEQQDLFEMFVGKIREREKVYVR